MTFIISHHQASVKIFHFLYLLALTLRILKSVITVSFHFCKVKYIPTTMIVNLDDNVSSGCFALGILYQQSLIFSTWESDDLPVSGRSIETTKKGAARKHLFRRVWKLVRNANGNIFCSVSTFINLVSTVINLDHLNGDSGAIVDSDPGRSFRFGVTKSVGTLIFSLIIICNISVQGTLRF